MNSSVLADARNSSIPLLVEHPYRDRRVPARQPGSGEATGPWPMLIPSGASRGARVERAKVSAALQLKVRAIPTRKCVCNPSTYHAKVIEDLI